MVEEALRLKSFMREKRPPQILGLGPKRWDLEPAQVVLVMLTDICGVCCTAARSPVQSCGVLVLWRLRENDGDFSG